MRRKRRSSRGRNGRWKRQSAKCIAQRLKIPPDKAIELRAILLKKGLIVCPTTPPSKVAEEAEAYLERLGISLTLLRTYRRCAKRLLLDKSDNGGRQ